METQQPQGISLNQVIDILLRRKALIATSLLLAISLGILFYFYQPKTYQGTALLSYQQQSINPTQMSPDEQASIQNIVSTLSEIVTSRTSLEKIITNEDLYSNQRDQLPMEDVILSMRKNITITPSRRGDTFIVTYDYRDPQKVAKVTNALASAFIEENMKYREEKATETSTYTKDELEMAKVILDRKEAVMRDYTLKHYNEMPEQRESNMARLDSLQTQYQGRQESIQELERTRVLIRDQIAVRKQILAAGLDGAENQPQTVETEQMQLMRLTQNLATLEERYTDKHPKIKSLKKRIARLKKSVSASQNDLAGNSSQETPPNFDSTLFDLQTELKGIGLSIDKINNEKKDIQALIKVYEQWVEAAPVREAEWSALTREYGELRRHYDFLVSQNLQAGSALNLERKQKGSQFKIVDPARIPLKPVKPDFMRIMQFALLGGALVAGAIIAALDLLNTSFRDPAKLSQSFGIEVICSVPRVTLRKEIIRQRLLSIFGYFFFFSWTGALAFALFYLTQQGLLIL